MQFKSFFLGKFILIIFLINSAVLSAQDPFLGIRRLVEICPNIQLDGFCQDLIRVDTDNSGTFEYEIVRTRLRNISTCTPYQPDELVNGGIGVIGIGDPPVLPDGPGSENIEILEYYSSTATSGMLDSLIITRTVRRNLNPETSPVRIYTWKDTSGDCAWEVEGATSLDFMGDIITPCNTTFDGQSIFGSRRDGPSCVYTFLDFPNTYSLLDNEQGQTYVFSNTQTTAIFSPNSSPVRNLITEFINTDRSTESTFASVTFELRTETTECWRELPLPDDLTQLIEERPCSPGPGPGEEEVFVQDLPLGSAMQYLLLVVLLIGTSSLLLFYKKI